MHPTVIGGQAAHPRSTELECRPLSGAAGEERAQTTAGVGGKVETGTQDSGFPRQLEGRKLCGQCSSPGSGRVYRKCSALCLGSSNPYMAGGGLTLGPGLLTRR